MKDYSNALSRIIADVSDLTPDNAAFLIKTTGEIVPIPPKGKCFTIEEIQDTIDATTVQRLRLSDRLMGLLANQDETLDFFKPLMDYEIWMDEDGHPKELKLNPYAVAMTQYPHPLVGDVLVIHLSQQPQ